MLSFGLLIACNLLVERIPSLSGPVTRGNLRTPEGEAGEEKWKREGGREKPGEVVGLRGQDMEGEEEEMRRGHHKMRLGKYQHQQHSQVYFAGVDLRLESVPVLPNKDTHKQTAILISILKIKYFLFALFKGHGVNEQ